MALEYTEEKRNSLDKETVIRLFLAQQWQLKEIDRTLQLLQGEKLVNRRKTPPGSAQRKDRERGKRIIPVFRLQ